MYKFKIKRLLGSSILSLICILQLNGQYSNNDLESHVKDHVMWIKVNFSDQLTTTDPAIFETNSFASLEDFSKHLPTDYNFQNLKDHCNEYSNYIIKFNENRNTTAEIVIEEFTSQINSSVDDDIQSLPECFVSWYNNQVMIEVSAAVCIASTCIETLGVGCAVCWVGSMAATAANTNVYNQCMQQY